ncbi:MAG TPA: hypothetical protein PLZ15_05475 [Melioribacteraceae bacterium]|nr:hypothetical protein [Melioribacteraceae bacterium]
MRTADRKDSIALTILFLCLFNSFNLAQEKESEYFLKGFFVRGAYTSFNQAMILNWDEREMMLNQSKNMIAYGFGYALLPKDFWAGLSASANYSTTKLNPFKARKILDSNMPVDFSDLLSYNDIGYSMLMFDFNVHILPFNNFPLALTLGFVLGASFQSYTISGDSSPFNNANGSNSVNMFRYGFILGCKFVPFKFLSVDFEFRPMSAYTETIHYYDYLYSDDTYDYFGSSSTSSGPSERFILIGASIHF